MTVLVLFRRGGATEAADRGAFSIAALPVFIVASLVLYAPSLQLGLLSDDFVLRATARAGGSITGVEGGVDRHLAARRRSLRPRRCG